MASPRVSLPPAATLKHICHDLYNFPAVKQGQKKTASSSSFSPSIDTRLAHMKQRDEVIIQKGKLFTSLPFSRYEESHNIARSQLFFAAKGLLFIAILFIRRLDKHWHLALGPRSAAEELLGEEDGDGGRGAHQ